VAGPVVLTFIDIYTSVKIKTESVPFGGVVSEVVDAVDQRSSTFSIGCHESFSALDNSSSTWQHQSIGLKTVEYNIWDIFKCWTSGQLSFIGADISITLVIETTAFTF
jgi:hypothetical protein